MYKATEKYEVYCDIQDAVQYSMRQKLGSNVAWRMGMGWQNAKFNRFVEQAPFIVRRPSHKLKFWFLKKSYNAQF